VSREELFNVLKKNHFNQLPEWSVVLNKWGIPEGFPIDLPVYDCDTKSGRELCFNDPVWRMAVDSVGEIVGDAGMSKAWWTIELGRTEKEWEYWWKNRAPLILPQNTAFSA